LENEPRSSLANSKINRSGLPKGMLAPPIGGASISDHKERSVIGFRGRKLLLIFSDATCEPCNILAPQLENLHKRTPDIAVLMISRGGGEANRAKIKEHGLTFPIILQQQWEMSRGYALFVTPCAYLIDENGVIASDAAIGPDAILTLLTGAAIMSLLQS
jgi:peroxiredoxin